MLFLTLIIVGLLVGVISSLFGVGGGILVVPAIYMLFPEIDPKTAIGSSLVFIFLNTSLNFFRFQKMGYKLNKKLFGIISLGFILGIFAGSRLVSVLDPKLIKLLFGAITLFIGLRILFKSKKSDDENSEEVETKPLLSILTGLFAGVISGLTGLGGGAVLVPLFITLLKIPLNQVSFLSNAIMPIGTLFGAVSFISLTSPAYIPKIFESFQLGQVNLAIAIIIFLGAFLTGRQGIKIGEKFPEIWRNRLFALLLFILSGKIFISYLL